MENFQLLLILRCHLTNFSQKDLVNHKCDGVAKLTTFRILQHDKSCALAILHFVNDLTCDINRVIIIIIIIINFTYIQRHSNILAYVVLPSLNAPITCSGEPGSSESNMIV